MDSIAPVNQGSTLLRTGQLSTPFAPAGLDKASSPNFKALVANDASINKASVSNADQKAISEYASIITTQFVGSIFDEQSGLFDSGDGASQHYHTMLIEAVSDQLTETDALGLKSIIQREISN